MKQQGMKRIEGIQSGQGGFTLIELLIVVAIIGVLAAIAIPQYQNYVSESATSACKSDMRAYGTAVAVDRSQGNTARAVDEVLPKYNTDGSGDADSTACSQITADAGASTISGAAHSPGNSDIEVDIGIVGS